MPLIESTASAARLREIAAGWAGTPWVAEGCIRGTGASCTGLPYGILREFGMEIPQPRSRIGLAKSEVLPACRAFLDSHPDLFAPVSCGVTRAGDVLLYDCGIGHLALCTGPDEIIHSWQHTGAHFGTTAEARLASRLRGVWRPLNP